MEQVTLYYRQGSSDKIYQASIESRDGGYAVVFAFGRRGATLQTGVKTSKPVSHEEAQKILSKLIEEKKAKGYTPGEDGTIYQHTDKEELKTGIYCQLLNPVTDREMAALIQDPGYWLQEKKDGRRLLLRKSGSLIIGINRLGLKVSLPKPMHDDAAKCPSDFVMDGEAVGDVLHVFDLSALGQADISSLPYRERHAQLVDLLTSFDPISLPLVATARTTDEKQKMLDELRSLGREGVVLKKIDQPYVAGRPSSGGPALKFKFHETASFFVSGVNAKRSVSLSLLDGEAVRAAGNVTIPSNREIPETGAIVEVRYLYAFKESGHIYQPVYLGARDDIPKEECTVDQLKYKAES